MTRSTTGRETWSAPVVAGNVPGRTAFFASIAVNPQGDVDGVFQALDDVPTGTAPVAGVVSYSTQSTDGGARFSSPLKLSTVGSDPGGSSAKSLAAQFLSDYISAIAAMSMPCGPTHAMPRHVRLWMPIERELRQPQM